MALETTVGGLAFLVGRLVFGVLLGFMGLNHFTGLDGMSGYAAAKGIPAPRLAVIGSGLMLILGGLAIALGVYPLVGAAAIALFFLGVTPVMHDFWTVGDSEQHQSEMTDFLKNATLFGAALVLVAISGTAWPYALNIGL
ncbi:DoxX family protein [Natrinema versiforme]|uniref:DoxX family protein n=1 Tax=Natrinema versiforme TaxID=88724 RepID=A0A4P8WM55_9EURY|nr:DoxX family protein [Natrinema versiforme]QCS44484.1 DoxX family protein [Natrinema versiforme]